MDRTLFFYALSGHIPDICLCHQVTHHHWPMLTGSSGYAWVYGCPLKCRTSQLVPTQCCSRKWGIREEGKKGRREEGRVHLTSYIWFYISIYTFFNISFHLTIYIFILKTPKKEGSFFNLRGQNSKCLSPPEVYECMCMLGKTLHIWV